MQLSWGRRAASPSSPLKAASFSGRLSSSLYFWSQRNSCGEDSTEHAVSRQSSPRHRLPARCRLSRQVAGLGRAEREASGLSWPPVNPQGQTCTVQPVGRKFV